MAATYSVGERSPAAAAGAAYAAIEAGSRPVRLRELDIACATAVASSIGLIRPSNSPVQTTRTQGQAEDTANAASTTYLETAWSTAPTIPGTPIYLRRITLPAAIGAGIIWQWAPGEELVIPANGWLVLWNFGAGAGAALDVSAAWVE